MFFCLLQLEAVELVNIVPPIPPISPRFGEIQNISLVVTPEIANGEIGFVSNLPIILHEPEDFTAEVVSRLFLIDGAYWVWDRDTFSEGESG